MARVSQLFDVKNKFTIDAIIAPYSIGERELASLHAFQLRPTDLLLLDRGYALRLIFVGKKTPQFGRLRESLYQNIK